MASTVALQQSRVIPVGVDDTFAGTLPIPSGGATTVTWHWTIHAASAVSARLLPIVGALWKGYARQSLAVLSSELTR